jgi:uncharacterized repeat protein (TIGR01451 family)
MKSFRHNHRKWRIWRNKFSVSKLVKKITPLMLAVLMSKNVDGQGLPIFQIWDVGYGIQYGSYFFFSPYSNFFDIDNDGDFDVINVLEDGSYPKDRLFFENKGNNQFANFTGTLNNDSFLEILKNTNFLAIDSLHYENGFRYRQFFDIDSDNDFDLLTFSQNKLSIEIHQNNLSNNKNVFTINPIHFDFISSNVNYRIRKVERINEDSNYDLIIVNPSNQNDTTFYILNEGTNESPIFSWEKRKELFSGGISYLIDFNNDGLLDLGKEKKNHSPVYGDYSEIVFNKCLSKDPLTFDDKDYLFTIIGEGSYKDVEDIDNDGDLDLFFAFPEEHHYGYIGWYGFMLENIGMRTNEINGNVNIDLDGDGIFTQEENYNSKEITKLDGYGEPYTETIYFHKLTNHPIVAEGVDYIFPIDENGEFTVYTPDGTQKIYPKPVPNFEFEPPFYTYDFPADTNISVSNVQFVMKPITGRYDVAVDISGLATRPGFETKQYLHYKNLAENPTNGTLSYTPPSELMVLSAQPNYDRMESGVYYWDIENLQALESEQIEVNLIVDANAALNKPIQSIVGFEFTNSTDFNPLNNIDTLFGNITGSFDPNDKLVTPTGLNDGLTAVTDQPFEYTIRFQNMGNDTAFTVIITDTLDTDFNLSSFEMVGSSHHYELSVRDNNVLIWKFRNILLPPSSTNLTGSQGFVKYRFTPKEGADIGTIFTNQANIYFDYNTPVETNETKNIFGVISGIYNHQHQQNIASKAYPNPTRERLLIEFNNPEKQAAIITIYDINGKQLLQKTIEDNFFSFNTEAFANGIYLYTIESIQGFGKGKFVKE